MVRKKVRRQEDKPLVWLADKPKTPPMSEDARREAGMLLRKLQYGELLQMPASRPMPQIGKNCHELRIKDSEKNTTWRIFYKIDDDAIVILETIKKKKNKTPEKAKKVCKDRLKLYKDTIEE